MPGISEDIPLDDVASGHTRADVARISITDNTPLDTFTPTDATGGGGNVNVFTGEAAETSFGNNRDIDTYGNPIYYPDIPIGEPSIRAGDKIENLWAELDYGTLEDAKNRMVDKFYNSIRNAYKGLKFPQETPYDQFKVGEEEGKKNVYWTPKQGTNISIINRMGGGFLALSTLTSRYGYGGTDAIRTSLGFENYKKNTRGKLSPEVQEKIEQASNNISNENEEITPVVIKQADESAEIAAEALDEQLTPEQSAALDTINDPPLDLQWVSQASRELRGLRSAMTRMRDELVNNLAKLSELDKDIAEKKSELEKATDETTKDRIAERLSQLQDERAAHLEATSATRETIRSQINRIRETLHRILHEDKTLAERIKT